MTAPAAPTATVPGPAGTAASPRPSATVVERATDRPGEPAAPAPSRTPRFLRRLQVLVALAAVLAGALATWVIVDLRADLATSAQAARQYATLGQVHHALNSAADHAARSVLADETAGGQRAKVAGEDLAAAAGLLVDAARAHPEDAQALNAISQQVSRYAQALAPALGGPDHARALSQLAAADTQLDKALEQIETMQAGLSDQAAARPLTQSWAIVVWPLVAGLAVVVWASWALARLSHRVVNLGVAGTALAIVLVATMALGAQASAADAFRVSRTEQFASVVNTAAAVDGLDRAQRVLTSAVLRQSWGSGPDGDYADALAGARKAAAAEALPSLSSYDAAKVALATQMTKRDWAGAAKSLNATSDTALDSLADEFRQAAGSRTSASLAEAEAAPRGAGNVMAAQLVFAILFALAGAALGALGIDRRLQEYR